MLLVGAKIQSTCDMLAPALESELEAADWSPASSTITQSVTSSVYSASRLVGFPHGYRTMTPVIGSNSPGFLTGPVAGGVERWPSPIRSSIRSSSAVIPMGR